MSVVGTKRTSPSIRAMSAFGGKADIGWNAKNVAFDPKRHFNRINCCAAQQP